jgi:hypothetical protein
MTQHFEPGSPRRKLRWLFENFPIVFQILPQVQRLHSSRRLETPKNKDIYIVGTNGLFFLQHSTDQTRVVLKCTGRKAEINSMAEDWKSTWQTFHESVESRRRRFLSELNGAWNDLAAVHRRLQQAFTGQNKGPWEQASLTTASPILAQAGSALLREPLEQYQQSKPIRRALSAIEEYESTVEDLARLLPDSLPLSGREFAALANPTAAPWWVKSASGWRSAGRPLTLRRLLLDYFLKESCHRIVLDDSFQLILAKSSLELREPWQIYRDQLLRQFAGHGFEAGLVAAEWDRWLQRTTAVGREALELLNDYENWADHAPRRLGGAIWPRLWQIDSIRKRSVVRGERRRQAARAFWSKQHRAVTAILDLEISFRSLSSEILRLTSSELDSLRQEHQELQKALTTLLERLRGDTASISDFELPSYTAQMRSVDDRVEQWAGQLCLAATRLLPEKLETLNPRQLVRSLQKVRKNLEPQKGFVTALQNFGKPLAAKAFSGIVERNLAITREIEHAREVVEYGLEISRTESDAKGQLLIEAAKNARSLLLEQVRTKVDEDQASSRCIEALVAVSQEAHASFEISRVGLIAHLTRLQGRKAWDEIARRSGRGIRAGSLRLQDGVRQSFNWLLLRIGWRLPPRSVLTPVIRRPALTQVLEVPSIEHDLPRIYRHLFRLAPVEDRRFLVGRGEELRGFEQALSDWQKGHFAATLLVGARGSGKTSILNCFAANVPVEQDLVRGQFSQRITSSAPMQTFLRGLFGFSDHTDLAGALAAGRRVVILEEIERTFLRKVNGLEAIHYLLQLIHPTAASTLWILSLNDDAFSYLDVAVHLGRFFSQRINDI